MNKTVYVLMIIALTTVFASPPFAQDDLRTGGPLPTPAEPAKPAVSPAESPTSQPLPQATVEKEPQLRDPFWPIGYKKQKPKDLQKEVKKVEEDKRKLIKWPKLNVKGITKGVGGYVALVKDVGIVSPGRIIKIESKRLVYRWKIKAISATGLSLRKLDVTPRGRGKQPIMVYSKD